jgi:sulfoxide reductase catalytic subunit YedY
MFIRKQRGWEIRESEATPEAVFRDRRRFIQAAAAGSIAAAAAPLLGWAGAGLAAETAPDPAADLYPAKRNELYQLDRAVTDEKQVESYNNFYEFGADKDIAPAAQALKIRPWTVTIDGLVEKPMTIAFDDLVRKMPLEERLYRHRCVEAWSMAVPWTGFPLKSLVDFARPLGAAKYVQMETFKDTSVAPGQKQFWYPWPYTEGLTMAEAANDMSFIVTGAYGKPIAKPNGAPLRLATPWKYGFKSVKSIVKLSFTDKRPTTFWEKLAANEYGFWANVNPAVSHPRWSQASERILGTGERRPTLIWNGYGEFVAAMYDGLKSEKLFV